MKIRYDVYCAQTKSPVIFLCAGGEAERRFPHPKFFYDPRLLPARIPPGSMDDIEVCEIENDSQTRILTYSRIGCAVMRRHSMVYCL